VIDLHAHPLPGVDDGPAGQEQALALAAAAADAGTRVMAATPHIDHRWRVDPAQVPERVRELNEHLARAGVELTVVQGGEIAASRLGELDAAELDAVRLGDGPYLLIECPHASAGAAFEMMVFEALAHGKRVVLGHPERSPVFARDLEGLERLVRSGALCSITAGSLAGRFGPSARQLALRMLAEGLVHDVASDAHDADGRPPALVEGMRAADDDLPGMIEQAPWYLEAAPKAILAGDPLPPRPDPPPLRRRLLGRLGLRRA
jgi:protein-tyrosine phosphatase